MSASEKLKALEEAKQPPWLAGELRPDEAYAALANALPRIVAVVEAAEQIDDEFYQTLAAALAALDEALA